MYQYVHRNGSYYLEDAHGNVRLMTDQVAVAYDSDTFHVHKHGAPDQVMGWMRTANMKMLGYASFNAVTFPRGYDVEQINRILSTSGYLKFLMPDLTAENLPV